MKIVAGWRRAALSHLHLLAGTGMKPVMDRQFGSVKMGSMSGRILSISRAILGAVR